jgi:hypothetical protein
MLPRTYFRLAWAAALLVGMCGLAAPAAAQANRPDLRPSFDRERVQAELDRRAYRERQEAEERRRYQEYLRNNDHERGISQQSGPTGGRTSDGGGVWGGWRWRLD